MEGPSVHYLTDELQRLEGQRIEQVSGNAQQPLAKLEGETVTGVRAVKKRLFIETGPATVVIHFLIYGTYRINSRRDMEERLQLACEDDILNVYSASVKVFDPGSDALAALDDPDHDILSPTFDRDDAVDALQARDDPVASVLLDQTVFGGIGNIIKNEVLFQERINPRTPASSLSHEQAVALVDAARDWAQDWYQRKQDGGETPFAVYQGGTCPACGADIEQADIGTHHRRTYWCPQCQPGPDR